LADREKTETPGTFRYRLSAIGRRAPQSFKIWQFSIKEIQTTTNLLGSPCDLIGICRFTTGVSVCSEGMIKCRDSEKTNIRSLAVICCDVFIVILTA